MWLKTSDDFPEECARADLSDAAYRTHHEGLSWVMRRETGGYLTKRDVQRFAESEQADAAVAELVACGFWVTVAGGYQVVHHMEHQPEPDLIQTRRAAAAERQRRLRRKQAGLADVEVSRRQSPRESRRDETRDAGRDGPGRDGPGNYVKGPPTEPVASGSAQPQACSWCRSDGGCDCFAGADS